VSSFLEKLKSKGPPAAQKDRILIYGTAGIGKTEFAANFKNPIFLMSQGETGLVKLMEYGSVPKIECVEFRNDTGKHNAVDDYLATLDALAAEKHDHKTVVSDVFSGMVELRRLKTLDENFKGDDGKKEGGFNHFGAGAEKVLSQIIVDFLPRFDALIQAGMTVVLLCHSETKLIQNPEGADYMKYISAMPEKIHNRVVNWADMVLFCKSEPILTGEKSFGDKMKYKSVGENRVIRTVDSPSSAGKNRHGLPPEISMGSSGTDAYQNLVAALKESKERNKVNS
jgi:hypothetical protein